MNRIKNIFNNVVFRKILVIFFVGLVFRGIINYIYEVGVIRDYINIIYYISMVWFSGVIYELPSNVLMVFDFKLIKSAIKSFVRGNFIGKMLLLDEISINDKSKDILNDGLVFKQDESGGKGSYRSGSRVSSHRSDGSAGVKGLYTKGIKGKSSAGISGLYDYKEEEIKRSNKHSKLKDHGRRHKHSSGTRYLERNLLVSRKDIHEIDGKSIYEKDGVSIYELGQNNSAPKVYELEGNMDSLKRPNTSYNSSDVQYIPYRPAPVELDGYPVNGKIRSGNKVSYPWCPDSYDKNSTSNEIVKSWDVDLYPRYYKGVEYIDRKPVFSDSTKLGEIFPRTSSSINEYSRKHPFNENYHKSINTNLVQGNKKVKVVGKLFRWF